MNPTSDLLFPSVLADSGYGGLVIFAVWLLFGLLSALSKKKKRRSPSQIPTPPGGFDPEDAPPGAPTTDDAPDFILYDDKPPAPEPRKPYIHPRRVRIPRRPVEQHPIVPPTPAPVAPPPALEEAPIEQTSDPVVHTRQGERHILDTSASASGLVLPSLHSMNVPFIPLPILPLGDTRRAPSANRPDLRSRPALRRAILAREILRPRNP